jgi:hypothetical protein
MYALQFTEAIPESDRRSQDKEQLIRRNTDAGGRRFCQRHSKQAKHAGSKATANSLKLRSNTN